MELRLALDIGVNPSHIVFNGPGKVDEALRLAIRAGVGFLNADSMSELFSINRIAAELDQPVQVGLRVGPTIARELHGRPTRFGVDLEGGLALDCLRKAAELERLRIHGIHFHLGTQIGSSTPFRQAVAETLELISRALDENLMEFRYLDIGGGFAAVPSTCRPELEAYMATQIDARVVESVLEPTAEALMGFNSPSILFEPGRLVVAQSALLLARVLAKTTHKATTGFVLDCGQTMLSSNLTLKLFHDVLPVQVRQDTSESPINLFGCLCYEADVISLALPLPPLENGDLVAVLDCGAYDMQLATPFIVSRPSVVLVEGNQALQIRYEEAVTAQSLVSLGVGPALLPLRVR